MGEGPPERDAELHAIGGAPAARPMEPRIVDGHLIEVRRLGVPGREARAAALTHAS